MNITDLFIIIWLLVMGIIDIKKKAVPLALLIIFSVMSILLKLVSAIRDRQQIYLLKTMPSKEPPLLFEFPLKMTVPPI